MHDLRLMRRGYELEGRNVQEERRDTLLDADLESFAPRSAAPPSGSLDRLSTRLPALPPGFAVKPWVWQAVISPPFCSPSITPTTRCSAKWQLGSLIH